MSYIEICQDEDTAPAGMLNLVVAASEVKNVYITEAPKASWGAVVVHTGGEHWFPTPTVKLLYGEIPGPETLDKRNLERKKEALNAEIEAWNQANAVYFIDTVRSIVGDGPRTGMRYVRITNKYRNHYPWTGGFKRELEAWEKRVREGDVTTRLGHGYPTIETQKQVPVVSSVLPADAPKPKKGLFR